MIRVHGRASRATCGSRRKQPGLWFHGGNLALSRQFSLLLALQLKARMEGLPTPVYGLQKVHHKS